MTANTNSKQTVLVVGGTGKPGRRVVERLRARGIDVRIGSRSGKPPFSWDDRNAWTATLEGVTDLYAYVPDLLVPDAAEAAEELARQAQARDIRRFVLLSGRGEEVSERAENLVSAAMANRTVVRCSWFNQNFDEGYMVDDIRAGVLALPGGDTPEPFVDADDIADVAVAALTEDGHEGRIYELTGPRLLTFAEATAEIARAIGHEVAYVPVTVDEFAGEAAARGVPEEFISVLRYLFTEVNDGRNASVTNGVREVLGREPKDFSQFADAAAASGAWEPEDR